MPSLEEDTMPSVWISCLQTLIGVPIFVVMLLTFWAWDGISWSLIRRVRAWQARGRGG